MPRDDPPIQLHPAIYESWLAEDPKTIGGGSMELQPIPESADQNMVNLPAYKVESEELPHHYADKLILFGMSNEFEGFKIWVTPHGFDYLLMAHREHHEGSFEDQYGNTYGNHPHFHELDLYRRWRNGKPRTRHIVPAELHDNTPAHTFLETFLDHYHFDDGRAGPIRPVEIEDSVQRKIHEFT